MRAYQSVWLAVCAASCGIGIAFAVFVCPLSVLLLMGVAALGIATLAVKVAPPAEGQLARHLGRVTAVCAPALIGVSGLIGAFAELGWLWLLCLAIAGAPVWLHRRFGPEAPPPAIRPAKPVKPVKLTKATVPEPRLADAAELAELVRTDTAEICWTWRRSYVALQQARKIDDRLKIVLLRQQCLDELSAREPSGFHAWLSAGARAASDPTRYVCPQRKNDQGKANH
ncbi:hypothetical protein [Labedaea rhizosphaerae]|uniref:Uncharacterized protein n=1 Tax=Labedaea rhizosphaerae TaxID=598644 RepID=A0A4R6RSW8_LABRH|nr:hypothetical protein [Labedaea rhizosphaerae]TDP89951.1 hypothetical protein EV186_11177 [Labedaea rhizosphaerae]